MDSQFWLQMKNRFFTLLNPTPPVGGLEISDTGVHYILLQDGLLQKAGVNLDPGVIDEGRLKDKEQFLKALVSLKSQLGNPNQKLSVVAVIPSNNIYTQAFNLPWLSETNLEEAANLNLQMISPVDSKSAYSDWQKLGDAQTGGKLELLGAFVNKPIVDDFLATLEEAGFLVVAVEFPSLAMSRTIQVYTKTLDSKTPQVILFISGDGLDFLILKDGHLYFSYFVSWASIKGNSNQDTHEILLKVFSQVLIQEMKKVFTFYSSHWGGQANNIVLITHGLHKEISQMIHDVFPVMQVQLLTLEGVGDLAPSWYVALGSALRGQIPRDQDHLITLSPVGTEAHFYRRELMNFIHVWKNVLITTTGFLFLAFVISHILLYNASQRLEVDIQAIGQNPQVAEIDALSRAASDFNLLTSKALTAKTQTDDFLPIFQNLVSLARASGVSVTRIFVDSARVSILFNGKAPNETTVVNFKNKLLEQKQFTNVSLPLAEIISNPDNSVSFSLSFGF